jgi:hypothetical protein
LFIISAVLSQVTFHQPGFSVARINAENPVKKDLRDLPPLFRHRTGSMRSIDSDLRVISAPYCLRLALKKPESVRHVGFQNELVKIFCQEILLSLFAESFVLILISNVCFGRVDLERKYDFRCDLNLNLRFPEKTREGSVGAPRLRGLSPTAVGGRETRSGRRPRGAV